MRVEAVATVRYETTPGHQLQIYLTSPTGQIAYWEAEFRLNRLEPLALLAHQKQLANLNRRV